MHRPRVASQLPVAHAWVKEEQSSATPTHLPAPSHWSLIVHASLSVQVVSLVRLLCTQRLCAEQTELTQGLGVVQSPLVPHSHWFCPRHIPPEHVSCAVQTLPSSHGVLSGILTSAGQSSANPEHASALSQGPRSGGRQT